MAEKDNANDDDYGGIPLGLGAGMEAKAKKDLAEAEEEEAEQETEAGRKKSKSKKLEANAEEGEAGAINDESSAIRKKAASESEEADSEEKRDRERWKWEKADRKKAARRETAEDVASAARAGYDAAKFVGGTGYGLAKVAANTLKPQGVTIFFFIALSVHIIDLAVDQFGKSNSGITGFRFGLYTFLMLYAWFAFYGGATAGLNSLKKPAAVSGLCFILPLILSLILKI
ncbi:MAG: hypothetical protein NT001_07105, partial [Candidatus Woesearchaeota archaeon]|nr:hypothetical protein [Candidatus Woesearchaeota archaeon]